jgi:sterol desaturase/sphingolipid hydroxylase (fatty acid hydroxylase superfamily)
MLDAFLNAISSQFGQVQQALFEAWVQPLVYALGMGNLLEDAYVATGWLLVGLLQLLIMLVVFGALERWRPVEALSDPAAVRTDVIYTLIHRLGLFRLALFFGVEPWVDDAFGWARVQGFNGIHLDEMAAPWWPGVSDTAWFSLMIYLLLFDFVDYWIHRGQHASNRWWALHAVHHSQRQMTMWSDNRNHLLDDMVRDLIIVLVARGVGVPPGQFVAVVALTLMVESLSHANTRLSFGPVFEKILVGPRFHRVHHGIGIGHESSGPGSLGGCNYAVLFPVWDILFRTADYRTPVEATGIRDQLPEMGGRNYGQGFWAQQWLGLLRLVGRA